MFWMTENEAFAIVVFFNICMMFAKCFAFMKRFRSVLHFANFLEILRNHYAFDVNHVSFVTVYNITKFN